MVESLDVIAGKEYVGRMIIVGKFDDNEFISYAVTGRSSSSQARILMSNLELEHGAAKTEPTDKNMLEKGIPALLIYNCFRRFNDNLIVSNGAQTDLIFKTMNSMRLNNKDFTSMEVLVEAFKWPYMVEGNKKIPFIDLTKFEPDEPNYTPRISAIITKDGAAMHIVRNINGKAMQSVYQLPLVNGQSSVISTYTGQNVPDGQVIPSFIGEPIIINGQFGSTPQEVTDAVYASLGPKKAGPGILKPGNDFRVGVSTLFYNRANDKFDSYIKNKIEMVK